jgi:SAM-dependent methyltransferase
MNAPTFDDLTDIYDAMIDWPKRLAAEEPFYRRLFREINAQSVVDVACGTGQHAAMFHSWGLTVEGSDISPRMIARAQAAFGTRGLSQFSRSEAEGKWDCPPRSAPHWTVRGFDEPVEPAQPFDVAVCVGNSLALAADREMIGRAIAQMLQAVRVGGTIVTQTLNLPRLPDGPCVWQKCKRAVLPRGNVLIVKGVHRCGNNGFVELIVTNLDGEVTMQSESVRFLGVEADELRQMAIDAGAKDVQIFGGYQSQPYNRTESVDLVMVARK